MVLTEPRTDATPRSPQPVDWLEAIPAAVLGVDAGGRICLVNTAAEKTFSGVRGFHGRSLSEALGSCDDLEALVERVRDTGIAIGSAPIAGLPQSNGGPRLQVSAAPVGEAGWVALVFSPSARGRGAGAAASRAAARLLAHEVRNPLAGIRAAAQLIGRSAGRENAELADLICAEVDRIGRLTERIEPLAGADAAADALNVHETLERVRQIVAASAPDVAIRELYDPSLPLVRGDFDQLVQAFLNIAKNAVEALAGQSGRKEIAFQTAYRPGVKVRASADAAARAQLEVQIVDNGPGLDPEMVERVFEPFATTKSDGMGLGLALVADIVARHGGSVEFESKPGRTAVRVFLPIEASL